MGFSASRLSFELIGEGVAIDPATGLLSIPADGLGAGITVIVTATDEAGSTMGRYRLILSAPATETDTETETETVAPFLRTAPALAGSAGTLAETAAIGAPVTLDPGVWDGTPAPSLAVAWLLDGEVDAGATGLSYVPQPADDGRALSARVTATNVAGEAYAETATCAIVHAAPTVVAPLADVAADAGAAPIVVEAAAAFAGAALTFAVNGTGATIDSATGVVTIATDKLIDGERITVTATNSGGSAQASFLATVRATPPVCRRPPALAETPEDKGVIGTPIALDPGAWEGVPAPELAIAWLLDGTVVEGAAGTSYTPAAADDGKRLSARVTATNAAGEDSADTAARAIVHAAPTVVAPLADLGLFAGDAPAVVEAAAAFAGNALVFAVEGGGATVDAKGRVSVPGTVAGSATVTVTATNSGGSATSSFQVTVVAADIPFALEAKDVEIVTAIWRPEAQETWFTPVVRFPGLVGETVDAIEWTTGKDPVPETQYEVVTKAGDSYQLYMRDPAKNAPGANPRADFSVWRLNETIRREALRFRWRRTAEGPWSNLSPAFSVPVVPSAPDAPGIVPPVLVLAPALAGTGRIGEPVTISAGSWSGVPAPSTSVAWLRDGTTIAGATSTSYTPVAADDGKGLSARVTATNAGGSAETVTAALAITYAPPVARGGLIEEIFDLGSGVQTVAAGADFSGENLSFAVTGAGATIDARTGLVGIPTDRAVQATVTVTATNSGGSATSSFQVTVEAEDIPFALEAEDVEIVTSVWRPEAQETWFTPVVRFPGLKGETVDAIEWTTSGKDPVPETECEVVAKVGDSYQLYMRDPAKNAPGANPRADFSVWRLNETTRREALRFRWRRTAEGPWSGLSPAFSVPEVPSAPAPDAPWLPLILRTKEQFEQKIAGGGGFQMFRSWGYSPAKPDRLFGTMDIDMPTRTEDFGDWWEPSPSLGLKVGISGQGCAIDSQDGDRILVMYSAASRRSLAGWNAQAGIYLSKDGGDSFTLVQQLDDLSGSSENGSRFMQFPFVEVPGGTPETRKWYAFQRRMPKGASVLDGNLWKSTDGGQSWAMTGEKLTVAKFGERLYAIRRAANGDFYFGTAKGLFRSTNEGGSWTKLASLPAGNVPEIDVKGPTGEVWACVEGKGLYRSTDHGTSWTVRKTNYDIETFAISPHDRKRILIAGANTPTRMIPQISTDGGATWSNIVTQSFPGEPEEFHSLIQGSHAYFIFHATDPNRVFAARFQHFGRSTDGGKTFVWASNNFDYNYVYDIGVDPGDWTQMALAMTDRFLVFTENGGDWVWDDAITNQVKAKVEAQAGYTGYAGGGRGALILRNGTQRRIISGVGNSVSEITVVHGPSGGNPIGSCSVPDHGGKVSWCSLGANDAKDASRGYIGRWRYDLGAGGMLTGPVDVTYEVIGVGRDAGVVFGVEKNSGEQIYRSTNYGASWSPWAKAPERFRPIDSKPELVTDRSQAARVMMVTASGNAYLIEGVTPTIRKIFDLRAQIGAGYPAYELLHCAFDPRDADIGYITANVYGGPSVFRTLDLTSKEPTWRDIGGNGPRQPRRIYVHPITGDVITSFHHGSMILPPPKGYKAAHGITASLYDRIGAFPGIRR